MRKLFAKKESQNSDNTKPAPQLLDTFLRFWKKDAAVERLTDITVKHSVLELQSGGKIEQKGLCLLGPKLFWTVQVQIITVEYQSF